ncbi:uncharacterized protein J7T54_008540 [Emericellopsis cladophorae]|uniref:Coenzyme Q-binding protein COQ10 START domain-containing protein n=1 Tax=Emericellopsis cladophorae TaxID=2686198 RepID=A0A9Q0BDA6_9HYPO|nr:uncharacterized protein J7T54_008540 [Emericellopsis cladophorae]KAI6780621.1 hypothetical protein J7T54_008540 [Emericellopsis cladophorae]
MSLRKRPSSRLSLMSTHTAASASSPSTSPTRSMSVRHSTSSSRTSLSSGTSPIHVSSIGEAVVADQEPKLTAQALPTPSFPDQQGLASLVCATKIAAPLGIVAGLLLDARTYSIWNPFCPTLTVTHQPVCTAPLPRCIRDTPDIDGIKTLHTTLRDATQFTLEMVVDTNAATRKKEKHNMQVTALEPIQREDGRRGVRVAWMVRGRMAKFFSGSERVQEFVEARDGSGVEYVCWETYYGRMSSGMKGGYGRGLEKGFRDAMAGLRDEAEKRARNMPVVQESIQDAGTTA